MNTTTSNTPTLLNIGKEAMTSLEIAEIVKREHKSVMRSIREMEDSWEKYEGASSRFRKEPQQFPMAFIRTCLVMYSARPSASTSPKI